MKEVLISKGEAVYIPYKGHVGSVVRERTPVILEVLIFDDLPDGLNLC